MNLMLATQTSKKHTIDSTPDYAKSLADIIIQLSQKLDDSLLEDLAKRVLNSRNSYTSGYGASDTAASLLAFRSMLGGIHFYHIHTSKETEMLHIMNNQDYEQSRHYISIFFKQPLTHRLYYNNRRTT